MSRARWWPSLFLALGILLAGCMQEAVPPSPIAAPPTLNGVTLPPDAAPADQQILIAAYDNTATFTTLDFFQSVYQQQGLGNLLSESLVRLDKNYQLHPGAATRWEVNSSGLVWRFHLDPNLIWTDDTPLTAADYVATFQYAADPKHAWDFSWFFEGTIKNWKEVVAGQLPLDQLGVTAVDTQTLEVTTVAPAPYLPAMLIYSAPMQQKALAAHGGLYNSSPATSVSAGPFVLQEWRKDERVVYAANPKYRGTNKPFIQKIYVIATAPANFFTAYQAGEIDGMSGGYLSPADNEIIAHDPQLQAQLHRQPNDFRTDYLFFDTQSPPFNNLKVRQAFSHVVDRDGLIANIVKPSQGIPAYSFLMPGFPVANSDGLKGIQNYDPALARQLLAEAGYPGGQGFPKLTLWLRAEAPVRQAVAAAIAASLKQNLGIEVEVVNQDFKTFTDALNAKPTRIQFGMVSYGMDFLDPYNMLSVWVSGGRHNWNNAQFDQLVKTAGAFTGDPATRIQMFQESERLLVTEAPGVFIYHRYESDLYKPYQKGSELEPDQTGVAGAHWPGYSTYSTLVGSLYLSRDVANFARKLPAP